MDFRRILIFVSLSAAILLGWNLLVVRNVQRAAQRQAQQQADREPDAADDDADPQPDEGQADEDQADDGPQIGPGGTDDDRPAVAEAPEDQDDRADEAPRDELPAHNPRTVTIGSSDPESGFFYQAELTSLRAAVMAIALNDPRSRNIEEPGKPLHLVEPVDVGKQTYRTFATTSRTLSADLKEAGGKPLDQVHWELVESTPGSATFRYELPGRWAITKQFFAPKPDPKKVGVPSGELRDRAAQGYFLDMAVTFENLSDAADEVAYTVQGPTGFLIENRDTAQKLRDIKLGYVADREPVDSELAVDDLIERVDENDVEDWTAPLRYVGIDGQFFAALVLPAKSERGTARGDDARPLDIYRAQLLERNAEREALSEVSVELIAQEVEVQPGGRLVDRWRLYAGPKRQALLDEIGAGAIIEYGIFAPISKAMLAVLHFLHNTVYLPYWLAIVCLTVIVRGLLFPISRKQALSAARMKELQPKLQELKKKYGSDRETLMKKQMELYREVGFNPLAGCLPMLLQLPIFIGLYWGLYAAIDLRGAELLWINNLAAPDQLFPFPFRLPYLGRWFNLLPLVTVVLFLLQQKMFMPPPDPDDEQAVLQHRMMNIMMFVMGFLFYHVPAGLCIYFIASSAWGMAERKLLDKHKKPAPADASGSNGKDKKAGGGGGGWNLFGGFGTKPDGNGSPQAAATKTGSSSKRQKKGGRNRPKTRR